MITISCPQEICLITVPVCLEYKCKECTLPFEISTINVTLALNCHVQANRPTYKHTILDQQKIKPRSTFIEVMLYTEGSRCRFGIHANKKTYG